MLLELKEVSKSFGDRTVLRDVNIRHDNPGLIGFMGPSGAGKSTLFDIIAGHQAPDSGCVEQSMSLDRVAWLAQSSPMLGRRSARDNVILGIALSHKAVSSMDTVVDNVMNQLKISHIAHRPAFTISGGERQRVAVARAIVAGAQLILADEPTASLDAESAQLVINSLASARDSGALVLVATHDLKVASACDSVYTFHAGGLKVETMVRGS